jgi:hypothetical protein
VAFLSDGSTSFCTTSALVLRCGMSSSSSSSSLSSSSSSVLSAGGGGGGGGEKHGGEGSGETTVPGTTLPLKFFPQCQMLVWFGGQYHCPGGCSSPHSMRTLSIVTFWHESKLPVDERNTPLFINVFFRCVQRFGWSLIRKIVSKEMGLCSHRRLGHQCR